MMPRIVPFDHRTSGIDGLVVLTMKQVTDERGTIREFFRASAFADAGVGPVGTFRQLNLTESRRGAIRGLHAEDMTKLVAVVAGEALGAYVDLRPTSPTVGVVETVRLVPGTQVLVPRGVANGFQALADDTQYVYCFDGEWQPGMAGSACSPLDPDLGIEWPVRVDPDDPSQVSVKDRSLPTRAQLMATMTTEGHR
jgi:dTDP-4-dehydrorhamnose 3,5-epimerase